MIWPESNKSAVPQSSR